MTRILAGTGGMSDGLEASYVSPCIRSTDRCRCHHHRGAAVFCSLELSGNPSGQFPNPPELRAKHHTLSFTLHAGVTKDGKNSFYLMASHRSNTASFTGRPAED